MPLGVLGSLCGGHCQIPPRLPFKEGLASTACWERSAVSPSGLSCQELPSPRRPPPGPAINLRSWGDLL